METDGGKQIKERKDKNKEKVWDEKHGR